MCVRARACVVVRVGATEREVIVGGARELGLRDTILSDFIYAFT